MIPQLALMGGSMLSKVIGNHIQNKQQENMLNQQQQQAQQQYTQNSYNTPRQPIGGQLWQQAQQGMNIQSMPGSIGYDINGDNNFAETDPAITGNIRNRANEMAQNLQQYQLGLKAKNAGFQTNNTLNNMINNETNAAMNNDFMNNLLNLNKQQQPNMDLISQLIGGM